MNAVQEATRPVGAHFFVFTEDEKVDETAHWSWVAVSLGDIPVSGGGGECDFTDSPLAANLWAVINALENVREHGYRGVTVLTANQRVVDEIYLPEPEEFLARKARNLLEEMGSLVAWIPSREILKIQTEEI
jgi:ribonuclease HI